MKLRILLSCILMMGGVAPVPAKGQVDSLFCAGEQAVANVDPLGVYHLYGTETGEFEVPSRLLLKIV